MSDSFETWKDVVDLGSGGFGTVKKVVTDRGEILAAKYINLMQSLTDSAYETFKNEVKIMKQMDHENIVRFVTVKKYSDQDVVFTEFIDGKTIKSYSPVKDQDKLQNFIKQICTGLHYMHTRNPPLLHRDIKGENIMVTKDGQVKLIDFGISMNLIVASGINVSKFIITITNGLCGTIPFMAPELLATANCRFSVKSDVWALGMTIYEMVGGLVPFSNCSTIEAIREKIINEGAPALPGNCSESLVNFYACCTVFKPENRMSVRELLLHSYLGGPV